MKKEQVKELFRKTSVKVTGIVLAAAIAAGSIWAVNYQSTSVPELVTYIDTEDIVEISEEEVPLANKKVTTSSKTTKTTKKVKLSTAATKTYSKKGKSSTSTSTKTSTTATTKTTTKTTVKKQTTSKYTKGSNVCKQVTTTKTTVKKTVVTSSAASSASTAAASAASEESENTSAVSTTTDATISALAPKVDSRVSSAWETLGFSFVINPSVSYSGLFEAKARTITLKTTGDTVYHELGHFLAFIAGNVDTSSSFVSVYNSEKDLYTSYNKAYVTADSSEYFAESFKEYTLDKAALKASRPQTYAAIEAALEKVTTAQITKIATVYAAVWNS